MNVLNSEEKVLAWDATWPISLQGTALVSKDFVYIAVSPQFCEILKVSPAELVGKRFTDITAYQTRDIDARNAQMVIEGKMKSFHIDTTYEFSNGRKVNALLLKVGVYNADREFLFFVSSILEQTVISKPSTWLSATLSALQKLIVHQYTKLAALLGAWAFGGIAAYFAAKFLQH